MTNPIPGETGGEQVPSAGLARLLKLLEMSPIDDPAQAVRLLSDLEVSPDDLAPWTDFGHPVCDSYGRKLVGRGGDFELMVMSWAPGDFSAIHDHGVAEWGAVRYFGPAQHVIFEDRDGVLSIGRQMTMRPGDVFGVDGSLIHLMGNASSRPFVSVHLYGRREPAPSVTAGARIFDLAEECIQRTDGGVFFCLPESEIAAREACPSAAPEVRLLHHRLMLDRIERMARAGAADHSTIVSRTKLVQEIPALQRLCERESA